MSRERFYYHELHRIENPGSYQSIANLLNSIAVDLDWDFSGLNGLEYVSEDAKKHHFSSDLEYNISLLKKEMNKESDETAISHFFENWMGKDNDYTYYNLKFLYNEEGKIEVLSLTAILET